MSTLCYVPSSQTRRARVNSTSDRWRWNNVSVPHPWQSVVLPALSLPLPNPGVPNVYFICNYCIRYYVSSVLLLAGSKYSHSPGPSFRTQRSLIGFLIRECKTDENVLLGVRASGFTQFRAMAVCVISAVVIEPPPSFRIVIAATTFEGRCADSRFLFFIDVDAAARCAAVVLPPGRGNGTTGT
mmetsp:Transcript_1929/g.6039  ORF Transcript_1929/g.6039 Transcript_1929/m.6039 type:complete len:184 (-) Transcript_1929:2956-3507(-)